MIVVDSSVVAFLLMEGELTPEARELYRRDPDWVTPPIINHELLNILSAIGASGNEEFDIMETLWKECRALLGARQQVPDPIKALRRSIQTGISGFEAQYLSLAEQIDRPLISEDPRILSAAPGRAFSISGYLERFGPG
jgi:predicted nucleic acid-binding protein